MKTLGVQTADFSAYYDLVQVLRARNVPFFPLRPGEDVPYHVGVVITTAREADAVTHPHVVVLTTPEETLAEALRILEAPGPFRQCVIGIDPGERPGVAVLADGRVFRLIHAPAPEAVREAVVRVLASLPAARFVIRIGHGAPTFRDRILQTLTGLDARIEIVDERRTTPANCHGNAERDTQAATAIALTPGHVLRPDDVRPVIPSEGELRDIQRKSRLISEGMVTISRALARNVALGHLTMDQAISLQQTKA